MSFCFLLEKKKNGERVTSVTYSVISVEVQEFTQWKNSLSNGITDITIAGVEAAKVINLTNDKHVQRRKQLISSSLNPTTDWQSSASFILQRNVRYSRNFTHCCEDEE